MAKPKNDSKPTTVTRIKASDDKKTAMKQPKDVQAKKVTQGDTEEPKRNILRRFLGYFSGAWFELKQVRWPNRRATWSMTAALLIFTALFVALILVTDTVWQYLFKLILE